MNFGTSGIIMEDRSTTDKKSTKPENVSEERMADAKPAGVEG